MVSYGWINVTDVCIRILVLQNKNYEGLSQYWYTIQIHIDIPFNTEHVRYVIQLQYGYCEFVLISRSILNTSSLSCDTTSIWIRRIRIDKPFNTLHTSDPHYGYGAHSIVIVLIGFSVWIHRIHINISFNTNHIWIGSSIWVWRIRIDIRFNTY